MTRPAVEQTWSVPVALHDVPATGRRFELAADEPTRAKIAKIAGLAALPRLAATFDVTRHGRDGLHVAGQVFATVGQVCIVTLVSIENEINEPIDIVFVPEVAPALVEDGDGAGIEVPVADAPEVLIGGIVDLGAIATEFLILGIDPYPRKPDAVFAPPPAGDDTARSFAALAALQKRPDRNDR